MMRIGKTKRDREAGAKARNIANKQARAAWDKDRKSPNAKFPATSCNGKKNRHRYMGKKGEYKIIA